MNSTSGQTNGQTSSASRQINTMSGETSTANKQTNKQTSTKSKQMNTRSE